MRVIEKKKISSNTYIINTKSPNLIDFFVNIKNDTTNLLNFDTKNQPKNKKRY